jgi:hypothetical protein
MVGLPHQVTLYVSTHRVYMVYIWVPFLQGIEHPNETCSGLGQGCQASPPFSEELLQSDHHRHM